MYNETKKSSIITPVMNPEAKTGYRDIGALWGKIGENGDEFFTGEITINGVKTQINVRRNKFKDNDKRPDWRIYLRVEQKQNIAPVEQDNEQTL